MFKDLLKKINEFDKITIFHHERPDGDAVFSSYALKEYINLNFKNKKVYLVGNDQYDVLNSVFKVKDSIIKDSLCIVLDTATKARVDDKRCFELSKYLIKIDHHPAYENYGDLNYVDDLCPATCQYLAEIFFSKTFAKYKLNEKICKLLYSGIVTDTMCFKTASCNYKTFDVASKLLKIGKFNSADIYFDVFSKDIKEFNALTKLRTYAKFDKKVGYIIVNQKDLVKIKLNYDRVKNNVDLLSNLKDVNIWAVFVENKKTKLYDGSIRSLNGYVINDIARKYNGGGHKYAVGVKGLKKADIIRLIKELQSVKKAHK